ncbi:hypothetical protein [Staphylococcus shinii]|uniref:hypothetical protein n=1 Tax=Staphylococcus shinii TaxID=2912228 RepID=UPI00298F3697|nr:hypothetical protein [Staphylococcus shinii]MDW8564685.1 hypothetical protein [Staphylococcus shinii]
MGRGRKEQYDYVVYKGDDVVCTGTRWEIIEKMKLTVSAFNAMTTAIRKEQWLHSDGITIAEKVSKAEVEKESKDVFV